MRSGCMLREGVKDDYPVADEKCNKALPGPSKFANPPPTDSKLGSAFSMCRIKPTIT